METEIPNNMKRDFHHLVDSISQDLVNINKGMLEIPCTFHFRNGYFTFFNNILEMSYGEPTTHNFRFDIQGNNLYAIMLNEKMIYPFVVTRYPEKVTYPDFNSIILLSEILTEFAQDNKDSQISRFTGE